MSPIPFCFGLLDIAKDEDIKARMIYHVRSDAGVGEEDDPRDEPDRQEYFAHHAQESDEEISVHAIDSFDVPVVSIEDGQGPS